MFIVVLGIIYQTGKNYFTPHHADLATTSASAGGGFDLGMMAGRGRAANGGEWQTARPAGPAVRDVLLLPPLAARGGGPACFLPRLLHGKTSPIFHYGDGLFQGIPSPFEATRYHSLIVDKPLPPSLEVTAFTREGELMGVAHREYPIYGVQFHPESILTASGKQILRNFLALGRPADRSQHATIQTTTAE